MESWQEKLTTHRQRMSHILGTGDISDVTFTVGTPPEHKTFKLHKVILSMCSDVFFTMFYGSLPEMDKIKVPDVLPEIFDITMKYVYEESFSVESMAEAMHTYCTAEKYNIARLRHLCACYITDHLCPENVPLLYKMPNLLDASQIKSKCEAMLCEEASVILTSDNFLKSPLEMVKHMVQLDELNVESEEKLFEFVLSWAKKKQNFESTQEGLRTIMNHFLPHIRFLAMSVKGFVYGPGNSGILTDSEIARIASHLVSPGHRELPSWCSKRKLRNKRFFNRDQFEKNIGFGFGIHPKSYSHPIYVGRPKFGATKHH